MLWLTGAATFEIGTTAVLIPIERVTGGQFLGPGRADREVVGSVILTANHCDELTVQYDLAVIGLGAGTQHLQRPFALEPAGYACRDYEARIGSLQAQ